MAADINVVCLTGRLVKDIEVKQAGQSNICSGTIAVNRSEKKDGQWVEAASFVDIKMWSKAGGQTDFYQNNLKKGVKVAVEGKMLQESWQGQDGQKHSRIVVMADNVIPMGAKGGSGADNSNFPSGFPQ